MRTEAYRRPFIHDTFIEHLLSSPQIELDLSRPEQLRLRPQGAQSRLAKEIVLSGPPPGKQDMRSVTLQLAQARQILCGFDVNVQSGKEIWGKSFVLFCFLI